jgi:hypothetical protein
MIGHFRELREIRACARDLPSQADPERASWAQIAQISRILSAHDFPMSDPRAIGGVPIRGSEGSGAGLSATKSAESTSHLAASEQCVLRTAGTPKSRPEKENRDEHRN